MPSSVQPTLEISNTQVRDVRSTILMVAGAVFLFDQLTKWLVLRVLGYAEEFVVVDGFFKFVHWGNKGAAWSLFNQWNGSNEMLAVISLLALLFLIFNAKQFDLSTALGRISMGLMIGGILGNVTDRLHPDRRHVIDFIYFYAYRESGREIGFPAFNIADSAICVGVGLMMLSVYRLGLTLQPPSSGSPSKSTNPIPETTRE